MRVQVLTYLDEIALIIGARPGMLSNLSVFKELFFGPLTAFRYRLNGPGSNADMAQKHIKGADKC